MAFQFGKLTIYCWPLELLVWLAKKVVRISRILKSKTSKDYKETK